MCHPLRCLLLLLLFASTAVAEAPAETPEEGQDAAEEQKLSVTLDDLSSVLGLSLGDDCESVIKKLGKTEYRFEFQDRKMISYNHKKQGVDLDVQCLDDAIASVGVRRFYKGRKKKRSRFSKRREASLLGAATAEQLLDALGEPAHDATSPLYRSLYYCAPQGGVIALHLDATALTLHHILLIRPALLSPDLAATVACDG